MDFFAFGAGDDRALAAENSRFGVHQGRTVRYIPWRGFEAVAIALVKVVFQCRRVAGHRLFQYVGLFAFVEDFGEQPQVVPTRFAVLGQGQEVAADQQRLVAFAVGELVVAAVTLEGAFGQVFAALAVGKSTWVIVVFEVGEGVAAVGAFQGQARFFEVVVAADASKN